MNTIQNRLDIMPSARCGLYVDGLWFLAQRALDSSFNPGGWQWLGGKVDLDEKGRPIEDHLQTALREAREEARIILHPSTELGIIEHHPVVGGRHHGRYSVTVGFLATSYSGEIQLNDECHGAGWFTTEQAMQLGLTPETSLGIQHALPILERAAPLLLQS